MSAQADSPWWRLIEPGTDMRSTSQIDRLFIGARTMTYSIYSSEAVFHSFPLPDFPTRYKLKWQCQSAMAVVHTVCSIQFSSTKMFKTFPSRPLRAFPRKKRWGFIRNYLVCGGTGKSCGCYAECNARPNVVYLLYRTKPVRWTLQVNMTNAQNHYTLHKFKIGRYAQESGFRHRKPCGYEMYPLV